MDFPFPSAAQKPFSYSLYPNHPIEDGKKMENNEAYFFPGHKIDLEVDMRDGKYKVEKILFYITPKDKTPMEEINEETIEYLTHK